MSLQLYITEIQYTYVILYIIQLVENTIHLPLNLFGPPLCCCPPPLLLPPPRPPNPKTTHLY